VPIEQEAGLTPQPVLRALKKRKSFAPSGILTIVSEFQIFLSPFFKAGHNITANCISLEHKFKLNRKNSFGSYLTENTFRRVHEDQRLMMFKELSPLVCVCQSEYTDRRFRQMQSFLVTM
jgi:hypothetical protein